MDIYRVYHSIRMLLIMSPTKRANYIKKHNVFNECGEGCMFMFRKVPLYSKCIKCGNNVRIASNVTLITHDAIHNMLNNSKKIKETEIKERIGCIEFKDNVFVGANSTILYDTKIGPNVIVAANSLVNKDIANGVYGGNPARYICSVDEYILKQRKRETKVSAYCAEDEISQSWLLFNDEHY